MTRRDQGNFFAGRAMKMTGTPESVWLSRFGAYQSNGNKTGVMFYAKAAFNWLDQKIMGAAISGTPMDGMKVKPIFLMIKFPKICKEQAIINMNNKYEK